MVRNPKRQPPKKKTFYVVAHEERDVDGFIATSLAAAVKEARVEMESDSSEESITVYQLVPRVRIERAELVEVKLS